MDPADVIACKDLILYYVKDWIKGLNQHNLRFELSLRRSCDKKSRPRQQESWDRHLQKKRPNRLKLTNSAMSSSKMLPKSSCHEIKANNSWCLGTRCLPLEFYADILTKKTWTTMPQGLIASADRFSFSLHLGEQDIFYLLMFIILPGKCRKKKLITETEKS